MRAACLLALVLPVSALAQGAASASLRAFDVARDTSAALQRRISLDLRGLPRAAVVDSIARRAGLSYTADATLPALATSISFRATNEAAGIALARLAREAGLELLVATSGSVVLRPMTRTLPPPAPPAVELERTNWRLTGRVRNARTLEPVGDARLSVAGVPYTANAAGLFSIPASSGPLTMRVRAMGFAPHDTTLAVAGHLTLDLQLDPRPIGLAPVQVTDTPDVLSDVDPGAVAMGVSRLAPRERRAAPALLGEPDPMRDLTTLTGIGTATDASTAVSVRGGRTDGNLLLLDGAPIYNPSHVFGLLSTLHSEATDVITVYKGTAPARFGGRLSSVIDVRQRDGNGRDVEGSTSIGLLSSRGLIEGPVGSRGSFMVAARRSYADLLFRNVVDRDEETIAYFYDLNGKVTWRAGRTGTLSASGYLGRDQFGFDVRNGASWGNTAGALRWSQVVSRRLLSTVTLSRGAYDFGFLLDAGPEDPVKWKAAITSTDLRVEQQLTLRGGRTLDFGGELALLKVEPGADVFGLDLNKLKRERRQGRSAALYASHEIDFGDGLALQLGLRWAGFERVGPATLYTYRGPPLGFDPAIGQYVQGQVVDSTSVRGGFAGTGGLEPRLGLRYTLDSASSLKISATRHRQYLHLGSAGAVPLPTDVFEPTGPWIRPMTGDQVSLGYARRMGLLEWSVEGWLRRSRNLVEYIDGVEVAEARQVETVIEQGEGRARGLEMFLRRRGSRGAWWVSYTLSRAEERFRARSLLSDLAASGQSGGLNDGRWFPAQLDRTHQLSATGTWKTQGRWELGATFTATSGLPTTLPLTRYVVGGLVLTEYQSRFGGRLPAYHRLDLGFTRRMRERAALQFGIVNAYHRFNAQFAGVRLGPNGLEQVQYSIFRAAPSVSYAWHF